MIRLADSSAGGWMTVQEYMSDDLSSDSEDSGKMPQAENRATKKRKLTFARKALSTFSSAVQFHQFSVRNPTLPYTGNQFRDAPSQAKKKDGSLYNHTTTTSNFKTPLTTVATVESSAIGNTAAPKRTLSSKIEVIPNRTDKTDDTK